MQSQQPVAVPRIPGALHRHAPPARETPPPDSAPDPAPPGQEQHTGPARDLFELTRMHFSDDEAAKHWDNIHRNMRRMSCALGRSVSLATSACDYFTGQHPVDSGMQLVSSKYLAMLRESVIKDDLTGLYNRRFFNSEICLEVERYIRHRNPFCLLMADIDRFKPFNDTHGHAAGDAMLVSIARALHENARSYDRVARYGGEEFAVILPQTRRGEAALIAERLRAAVEGQAALHDGATLGPLTISIGVAEFPGDSPGVAQLIACADKALYRAKERRNRVVVFQDPQRRHPRITARRLPLVWRAGGDGMALFGSALNISAGGLLCETDAPWPSSSRVLLLLDDPLRGCKVEVEARIERVQRVEDGRYHVGLSFHLEDPEAECGIFGLLVAISSTQH